MVEGAPLLREYTRKGIVGSNPIFSAILNDPLKSTLLMPRLTLSPALMAADAVCPATASKRLALKTGLRNPGAVELSPVADD